MGKLKKFGSVLLSTVLPLLAAFPWIALLTSPLAEEVIFRQKVTPYDWVLLAFFYLVYLFGGARVRLSFALLTVSSTGAFIASVILRALSEDACFPYCLGLISKRLGLACGYVDDACELENFLITFVIIALVGIMYRARIKSVRQ